MTVTSLVFGGLCFSAGVAVGVIMADRDYLHTEDLTCVGSKVVAYTKSISRKVRGEIQPESEPIILN